MEFDLKRTSQITGVLLLLAAVTQSIYTALYLSEAAVPRQLLWGSESVIFVLMAAFAGSALAQTRTQHLAWAAISAAAVLNVVQVGIGLTQFGPFFEAAGEVEGLAPAAGSIVALSFMIYNAAKVLLSLSLIAMALEHRRCGSPILGGLAVLLGLIAFVSNAASMTVGRDVFGELPLAGGSGVFVTVILAFYLLIPSETNKANG